MKLSEKISLNFNWLRVIWLYVAVIAFIYLVIDVDATIQKVRLTTLNRLRPASFDHIVEFHKDKGMFDKKKLEGFEHYYRKVAQYVPQQADAYGLWGYSLYYLGKKEKAAAAYIKAAEVEPYCYFYYHNLGLIYYDQAQYERSIEMLNKGIGSDPKDAVEVIKKSLRIYLPLIVLRMRSSAEELPAEIRESYRDMNILLVLSYYQLNRFDQMLEYSTKAAQNGLDNDGRFSFYRGLAAFNLKDYAKALMAFKAAVEKNPKNAEALEYLGKCLELTGNGQYAHKVHQQAELLKELHQEASYLSPGIEMVLF